MQAELVLLCQIDPCVQLAHVLILRSLDRGSLQSVISNNSKANSGWALPVPLLFHL